MVFFGYGRGVNRLWDIQVIPPIAALGILLIAFIAPLISAAMIVVYLLIVLGYTLAILTKAKRIEYFFSIPIVFVLEHIAYMFGFWKGTIESIIVGRAS
jgi:hypothetical protein